MIIGSVIALVTVIMVLTGFQMFTYAQTYILCEQISNGNTEQALRMIPFMPTVNSYNIPPILAEPYSILSGGMWTITTPLIEACGTGDIEVVTALLERGADPNKYKERTWSPIETVSIRGYANRVEIYEKLLNHGADVNSGRDYSNALYNEFGRLVRLHSKHENVIEKQQWKQEWDVVRSSIELFLDYGVGPQDEHGGTIVHFLCLAGETEWMKDCVDTYGYSLNEANDRNETPLHWAVRGESVDTVQYLLSQGVDTQVKDNKGKTAYDYAVESGNVEIMRLLEGSR